jgi:hypothetical protein
MLLPSGGLALVVLIVSAQLFLQVVNSAGLSSSGYAEPACGKGWQEDYRSLHASQLAGKIPARYIVATGHNGLAGKGLRTLEIARLKLPTPHVVCNIYLLPPCHADFFTGR